LTRTGQQTVTSAGEALPTAIKASALIDTGASGSAVQQGLLAPLGLHPVGQTSVVTPTTTGAGVNCPLYAVLLTMPNGWIEATMIEAPLANQNIEVLIGRDVLQHGLLIYQGRTGQFTLAFYGGVHGDPIRGTPDRSAPSDSPLTCVFRFRQALLGAVVRPPDRLAGSGLDTRLVYATVSIP